MPLAGRNVAPRTEGLQTIVALRHDGSIRVATQNVDRSPKPNLLIRTPDRRESLLYDDSAVKALRRILTHITVATLAVRRLAKIVKQNAASADRSLSILLHTLQIFEINFLLTALLSKLLERD